MSYFKLRLFFMMFIVVLILSSSYAFSFKGFIKSVSRIYKKVGQFVGLKETCTDKYLRTDKIGLRMEFQQKLHGQPIAVSEVPKILSNHWEDKSSNKHLMICFYGSPGTGKTFSTKLLKDYIFTKGDQSYFYLFYTGSEAYVSKDGLKQLKEEMDENIKEAINECPYSIIVFDEVDKYPDGFIDSLLDPFIKGLDGYRGKGTFIFLTNEGSNILMRNAFTIDSSYFWNHDIKAYEGVKYLLTGKSSVFSSGASFLNLEAIHVAFFSSLTGTSPTSLLSALGDNSVQLEQGSFYSSDLVQRQHLQLLIPFLPLKRESVILCLNKILTSISEHLKKSVIESVLDKLPKMTPTYPIYYLSGCKHLESAAYTSLRRLQRNSKEL